jgi:hypothetical protein
VLVERLCPGADQAEESVLTPYIAGNAFLRGFKQRRSREDLLDEIADVIITAAVAMSAAADNSANGAAAHLERRLDVFTARIGV